MLAELYDFAEGEFAGRMVRTARVASGNPDEMSSMRTKVSAIDVIMVVNGQDRNHAAATFRDLVKEYPSDLKDVEYLQFSGERDV
jgi:hypothetical protein